MKETQEESATLKQRLKKEPVTDELRSEAAEFTAEASESIEEVEEGWDFCTPDSWVAEILKADAEARRA